MLVGCLTIGLLGLLGMTWLFPLLGGAWRRLLPAEAPRIDQIQTPISLTILIPVHNDQEPLTQTLVSLERAIKVASLRVPELQVKLLVGCDGCSDDSAQVASQFGAEVICSELACGKWATLYRLVGASEASTWVALVDAGTLWTPDFLIRMSENFKRLELVGIAPGYRRHNSGLVEQSVWWLERHLKQLECLAGGPISAHGATVFYRRAELFKALRALSGKQWLNDDVVLPLYLRARFSGQIAYCGVEQVADSAEKGHVPQSFSEWNRRRRMLLGNIEWIRSVLPGVWFHNPLVGLLALRRVFRMFWIYWCLLLGAAILVWTFRTLSPETLALGTLGFLALLALLWRRSAALVAAGMVSLLAPIYLFSSGLRREVIWR